MSQRTQQEGVRPRRSRKLMPHEQRIRWAEDGDVGDCASTVGQSRGRKTASDLGDWILGETVYHLRCLDAVGFLLPDPY